MPANPVRRLERWQRRKARPAGARVGIVDRREVVRRAVLRLAKEGQVVQVVARRREVARARDTGPWPGTRRRLRENVEGRERERRCGQEPAERRRGHGPF